MAEAFCFIIPSFGADFTWNGSTSSDFSVGSNWGGNVAPAPTGGGTASPQAWRINVQAAPNPLVYSAAQGHTVLSGGGSNRSLFIANSSSGTMSITGGIFESTSAALDGMVNGANSVGILSIDGGTYRKTTGTGGQSTFAVRYNGSGTSQATLDINGGSFEVTTLDLQNTTASSTLAAGTPETMINLDGGILSVGTIVRSTTSADVDAVLNLNGGTLQARQDSTAFLPNLGLFTANVQAGGAVIDTQAFNVTIAAPLVHDSTLGGAADGGLSKTGGGTLTLSGANSYTGVTNVSGTNSAIVVANNQALGGTAGGTVVGNTARILLANGVVVTGETLTLTGAGGNNFGALQTTPGATAEWTGNVTVTGADSRIGAGSGGTLKVSGVISGSVAILFSRADNSTTILSAVNTYTGDTQMYSGGGTGSTLKIGVDNAINAASRLSVLGTAATNPMTLDLNGHVLTLRSLDTSGNHASGAVLSLANNAAATTTTLTLADPAANTATFAGAIRDGTSGEGGVSLVKAGADTQILIGNNTYSGSTTVKSGTLQVGASVAALGANGALASTSYLLNGGMLRIDNTGASNNNANRLPDSADVAFNGGSFSYKGSDQAATNSSETLHNLSVNAGAKSLSVNFGSTNVATVTANQLTRPSQGGVLLINGMNLGQDATSTSSTGRVFLVNAPTLIGGSDALSSGINPAAKDTKIVPFLLGEATSTSGGTGTATGGANTFVTYESGTGLRPLNPTDEFTENSFVSGNNTRLTSATNLSSSTHINSLVLAGGSATIASGQTLTVDSGAILAASGESLSINGGTLAFGASEGIVTLNSTLNTIISSVITGSAGMTYSGSGTLVLATQQNTYSGDTRLQVGTVIPQASSQGSPGSPSSGPFGTGTVILGGSAIRATTAGAITIGNNVNFAADTTVVSSGAPSNDKSLTFAGAVTLSGGDRTLTQSSGANTVISGAIGDGGNHYALTIAGSGAGAVVLSGANTYSGGTVVNQGTLLVNNTSGSGTGTGAVRVNSSATLGGNGTLGGPTVVSSGGKLTADADGSTGTLSFGSQSLTFDGGSTWLVDIAQGTGADRLASVGSFNVAGAGLVTLDLRFTGIYSPGQTYNLASYAPGTWNGGTFRYFDGSNFVTLADDSMFTSAAAGGSYLVNYDDTQGFTLTAVPEADGLLPLLALATAMWLTRRRRKFR